MLKKSFFFLTTLGLLAWSYYEGPDLPYFYFLLATVLLIWCFDFLSDRSRFGILACALIYAVMLLFEWQRIGHIFFFLQQFLILFMLGAWIYFLNYWNREVAVMDAQKTKAMQDMANLREKYNTRVESLEHLERQVGSLLDLFEVAKDFNECLYFDQLMSIVSKHVREEIPFRLLTLLLLSFPKEGRPPVISKTLKVGDGHESEYASPSPTGTDQMFADVTLKNRKVLQCETQKELQALDSDLTADIFPVWIFPLQVEEKLIAALIVQGGVVEDFPKFELLASQFALQVKKISLYETVKELSIVDGLTKTYVRRHFLERFEEELKRVIKRGGSLSVLMLDIDRFKSYNDKFGHLVGDGTLREVAAIIRENVRKVDLVARYGGEEFIVALPDAGSPLNVETAERIRSAIAHRRFRLYDEETKATVSIGVAAFPEDLNQPHVSEFHESIMLELIQKADKALYQAKEDGRNRVVSYSRFRSK